MVALDWNHELSAVANLPADSATMYFYAGVVRVRMK